MLSSCKRKPCSKSITNFTTNKLAKCLETATSGQISQRKVAAHYVICRSTIKNKLDNKLTKK
jgi:response regulator of citrate/malate metabolism